MCQLRVVVVATTPKQVIMAKHKTTYSWVIIVLTAIGLVFSFLGVIWSFINLELLMTEASFSNPVLNIINLGLSVLSVLIWTVFFFKLYNVTPDLIKWTHIAFGYEVFESIASLVLSFFSAGLYARLGVLPTMFFLGIVLVFWVTFVIHLQNARKEQLMDFS